MDEKNKLPENIEKGAGCQVCPKCGAELNIKIELEPAGTQPSEI